MFIRRLFVLSLLALCLLPTRSLQAEGDIPLLTTATFVNTIKNAQNPVLVEFIAVWCPYCKKQEPHIQELRRSHMGKVEVYQVNVDHEPAIADSYDAHILPTLIILYKGEVVGRSEGALYGDNLTDWVEDVQKDIRSRKAAHTNDSQAL